MDHDSKLVREIFLALEMATPAGWVVLEFPGRDPGVVREHARLLDEAGFLRLLVGPGLPRIARLAWQDRAFFEALKDPHTWSRVGEELDRLDGPESVEAVRALARIREGRPRLFRLEKDEGKAG